MWNEICDLGIAGTLVHFGGILVQLLNYRNKSKLINEA